MELYSENEKYKLYHGNMLDMDKVIEDGTIDSIVTDPPYGLTSIVKRFGKEGSAPAKEGKDGSFARLSKGFMGKEWDGSGIEYNIDAWRKCWNALKPGGYLLAFGGSRTYHRIACAIEDAGFEIRDCIMWLYGSGFPKSMNIGLAIDKKNGVESEVVGEGKSGSSATHTRTMTSETKDGKSVFGGEYQIKKASNEWNGWGTALKPSYEPIIVARKPLEGSCTDNVLKYGVGGINIDECRVQTNDIRSGGRKDGKVNTGVTNFKGTVGVIYDNGRYPANTILTYGEEDKEEVCSGFPNTKSQRTSGPLHDIRSGNFVGSGKTLDIEYERGYNDEGSAARYFYCAKASKRDRDEGCTELEDGLLRRMRADKDDSNPTGLNKEGRFAPVVRKNTHPTVKPCDLMQYLVRLVTPNGGTVLDPFNGSGSTGKAVMYENKDRNKNYKYIGIELTDEYLPIAKARIEYAINVVEEKQEDKQPTLFDI